MPVYDSRVCPEECRETSEWLKELVAESAQVRYQERPNSRVPAGIFWLEDLLKKREYEKATRNLFALPLKPKGLSTEREFCDRVKTSIREDESISDYPVSSDIQALR